jgi:hypothetical protein
MENQIYHQSRSANSSEGKLAKGVAQVEPDDLEFFLFPAWFFVRGRF